MKLYGSLTSPYVRKCRIVLREKGIACEFVAASPGDAPVARLNLLGKVPVLERESADASSPARGPRPGPIGDDGSALFDSPVIFEYLDSLKPPALLAASGEDRRQTLRLQALADGILDATVARTIGLRRPPEQQSAEERQKQEEKVTRAPVFAEGHAAGAYLLQNKFTAADLCLAVALEYVDFRYAHDWRARHPALARWLAGISARASFLDTVPPGLERSAPSPH